MAVQRRPATFLSALLPFWTIWAVQGRLVAFLSDLVPFWIILAVQGRMVASLRCILGGGATDPARHILWIPLTISM